MNKGQIRYHRAWLRLHKQYETYAYPLIKAALEDQIKPVIKWLDEDNFDALDAYLDYLLTTTPIREALIEIYEKVGVSAATFNYEWIQKEAERKDLAFFSEEWIKGMIDYFLLYSGNKIAGITQTTVERIRQILADSQGLNLSRRDQAKYIEDTLNDPSFNRNRALVIARTESTTAANKGITMGAQSSDYEVQKFWLATLDGRTRRSHRVAGMGGGIDPLEPFIVGGEQMMYPGDPSASAENVVNCRCVILTQAITDEYGLPVLKRIRAIA